MPLLPVGLTVGVQISTMAVVMRIGLGTSWWVIALWASGILVAAGLVFVGVVLADVRRERSDRARGFALRKRYGARLDSWFGPEVSPTDMNVLQLDRLLRRDSARGWPDLLTIWAEQGIPAQITVWAVPEGISLDRVVAVRDALHRTVGWLDLGEYRWTPFFDFDGSGMYFVPGVFQVPVDAVENAVLRALDAGKSDADAVVEGFWSVLNDTAARR